jgi:hypothetical protein
LLGNGGDLGGCIDEHDSGRTAGLVAEALQELIAGTDGSGPVDRFRSHHRGRRVVGGYDGQCGGAVVDEQQRSVGTVSTADESCRRIGFRDQADVRNAGPAQCA